MLRIIASVLLILATVAFVIGVIAERSVAGETDVHSLAEPPVAEGEAATRPDTEETGDHDDASGSREEVAGESGELVVAHADESESVLGANVESTGMVAAVVLLSLVLAGAVWLWGTPVLLFVVAACALLFTIFDLREVVHRVNEARNGLVVIALIVAALHAGGAVVALLAARQQRAPAQ